jgi:hypothetical protein
MKSLKRLFSAAPEGTAALFFIQIFSTLGFAVLYSTLVLYATKHLQLSVKAATTLMGVFGAFNLFIGIPPPRKWRRLPSFPVAGTHGRCRNAPRGSADAAAQSVAISGAKFGLICA